jgi:hypothetical protein
MLSVCAEKLGKKEEANEGIKIYKTLAGNT